MKFRVGDTFGRIQCEGNWQEDGTATNCTLRYHNGDLYTGACLEGVPSGKGVMKYKNKSEYEGDWFAGKPNGKGTKRFSDSTMYIGSFKDGK